MHPKFGKINYPKKLFETSLENFSYKKRPKSHIFHRNQI